MLLTFCTPLKTHLADDVHAVCQGGGGGMSPARAAVLRDVLVAGGAQVVGPVH